MATRMLHRVAPAGSRTWRPKDRHAPSVPAVDPMTAARVPVLTDGPYDVM
jgi:hypothetical protein